MHFSHRFLGTKIFKIFKFYTGSKHPKNAKGPLQDSIHQSSLLGHSALMALVPHRLRFGATLVQRLLKTDSVNKMVAVQWRFEREPVLWKWLQLLS